MTQSNLVMMETATWQFFMEVICQHVKGEGITVDVQNYDNINPDKLFELMVEHRVELIFYTYIKHQAQAVLGDLYPRFESRCVWRIRRNLLMEKQVIYLSRLFEQNAIQYVVLKGMPLNAQLYGNTFCRVSGDIDLLVSEANFIKAHELLIQQGYELTSILTPEQIMHTTPYMKDVHKDVSYFHPELKVAVELHYRVDPVIGDMFHPIQNNNISAFEITSGICINVISAEHNFFYLSLHGAKHNWFRLHWLIDLAVFYQKYALNWSKVIELTQRYQMVRPLLELSFLLKELFGMDMPNIPHAYQDTLRVQYRLRVTKKRWCNPFVYYRLSHHIAMAFLFQTINKKWLHFSRMLLRRKKLLLSLSKQPFQSRNKFLLLGLMDAFKKLVFPKWYN